MLNKFTYVDPKVCFSPVIALTKCQASLPCIDQMMTSPALDPQKWCYFQVALNNKPSAAHDMLVVICGPHHWQGPVSAKAQSGKSKLHEKQLILPCAPLHAARNSRF